MNRSQLIEAALGQRPLDLVIQNVQLINVYTGEIYPADIGIYQNYIAHVTMPGEEPLDGKTIISGTGKYAIPGFIDSHVHIESSMMTSVNFTRAILPHGTTTVITDPHEIGNVLGLRGVKYMVDSSEGLPLRNFILAPSCIPAVPEIETAGADFGAEEIATMLTWDRVIGLAEVMDYLGVIHQTPRMNAILDTVRKKGGYIQGHSPFVKGRELSAYLCAGPVSDHEVRTTDDALVKLRAGMTIDAKESSIVRNIGNIIAAYKELTLPPNITFCTDDREAGDLLHEGHMDEVVRRAIEEGLPPAVAIRIATLHAATQLGLTDLGAIAPGKKADIALLDHLETVKVNEVFVDGQLVAQNGRLTQNLPTYSFPIEKENTVKIDRELTENDFQLKAPAEDGAIKTRVLAYQPGEALRTEFDLVDLPVKNGLVAYEDIPDTNLITVIERHGRTNNQSFGILKNFGLAKGAIASTVSHDSHNLTVVGANAPDMLLAAKELIACGGGIVCVADGKVLAKIELPIAGLISPLPAEELAPIIEATKKTMAGLGLVGSDPLLRVATLALPVIPPAKITDIGLVEVETQQILPIFPEGEGLD